MTVHTIKKIFAGSKAIFPSFSTEREIRENRNIFRWFTQNTLDRHQLILAPMAMELLLRKLDGHPDEFRKDKSTPREQHEESHIIALDSALRKHGTGWIEVEKWGSKDALFAAALLHDAIEDLDMTANKIGRYLENEVEKEFRRGNITSAEHDRAYKDIAQIRVIVELLTKKDANGERLDGDLHKQSLRWLEHPYAIAIKMADWCNKLQTTIGVAAFEDNGQERLKANLDATSFLFRDEQQATIQKAIDKYPRMRGMAKAFDGIMGMQFEMLQTYHKVVKGELKFDPKYADPFKFPRHIFYALPMLRDMPKGCNYISPMIERFEIAGLGNQRLHDFNEHMVKPAFEIIDQPGIISLSKTFRTGFKLAAEKAASVYDHIRQGLGKLSL